MSQNSLNGKDPIFSYKGLDGPAKNIIVDKIMVQFFFHKFDCFEPAVEIAIPWLKEHDIQFVTTLIFVCID